MLFLITEYLSDGRLVRIVGQEGEQYVPLIKDPNVIEYDVIVDDAPSSPSQKELVWNSLVQVMPLMQNIQPPAEVYLALLDYSPIPSSVVAKIKQAVQQSQANQQPQPSPMDLMMQQAQVQIQTEAKRGQDRNAAKQAELIMDYQHKQALSELDVSTEMRKQNIQLDSKRQEAAIQNEAKRQQQIHDAELKRQTQNQIVQ